MAKEIFIYPSRSVHITRSDLGKVVKLKVSKDYKPQGVSFSPTVRGALEGVPFYYTRNSKDWSRRKKWLKEGSLWYVYTPTKKYKAIIPEVDDYSRTRERRVLSKVEAKRLGKIKVGISSDKWTYKWLKA